MSSWNKGKVGYRKGCKHSEETKNKMKGRIPWNYNGGKPKCPDCGKTLSTYKVKFCRNCSTKGDRNPAWLGGISFEPYPIKWTDKFKESIRERDNYVCQECGVHQDELKRKLHIHHIDYDKDNLNPDNLIALCINCHTKTNHNRDYWANYFKQ